MPRQNGKGGIIEALALGWLFLTQEKLVLWSAHEYKTAQEGYLRLRSLIQGTPMLAERVERIWQANGEQGVQIKAEYGGSRLRFIARSRTAGRGFTGHKIILDESQELTAGMMAAIMPTLSAVPNPQVWFFGTPPDDPDSWVYNLKEDAEAGADRVAWFNWGADEKDQRKWDDRDLWYETNPALGIRITEQFVADECRPSGLGDRFGRERLGIWLPRGVGAGIITEQQWQDISDSESKRNRSGDCAISVDISPLRDYASIAVFGVREDGLGHTQLVEYHPGTDWIIDRLIDLKAKLKPVGIAMGRGTAASLETELERCGITPPTDPEKPRRGDLAVLNATEMAGATAQFLDAVKQRSFRHVPSEQLDTAVMGGKVRGAGDGIAWSRKDLDVDISPLVAVTIARWALEERREAVRDHDVMKSIMWGVRPNGR